MQSPSQAPAAIAHISGPPDTPLAGIVSFFPREGGTLVTAQIHGLPYEDAASFSAGFDRAFALGPHQLQLGFLKLLRGSPLWQQADALGLQFEPAPPYEVSVLADDGTPLRTVITLPDAAFCTTCLAAMR